MRSLSSAAIGWSVAPAWRLWLVDEVAVGVPVVVVVAAAGVDLHESHAALDQPAGQQAARAEVAGLVAVEAVQVARRLRFLAQIDGFRRVGLHLVRQLVGGDARGQVVLIGPRGMMPVVHAGERVEHVALERPRHAGGQRRDR